MKRMSNIKCQITKKGFTLISKACKGFTLIEILVVISIIGILATLILARLGGVEKQGRDARRKSDLNQYRTALENYALKTNGLYPHYSTGKITTSTLCSSKLVSSYLATCLTDPREDAIYYYQYVSNGTAGKDDATLYALWATLEASSSVSNYYVCSNGKIGQKTSAPTLGTGNDCQ